MRNRIYSIDLLRGLVMIIMALDHTRDFIHHDAWVHNPLDLSTTSPWLYFTRWITHFCAPVFVLLSGTSIYLQSQRKTKGELSSFLFKRGLWLIFIEVVVQSFAFSFDIHYHLIVFQVIWTIGISMILLAGFIWLPWNAILITGLVIVLGHNALDGWAKEQGGPVLDLLKNGNFHYLTWRNHTLGVLYPFLPWTGVMLLGYCLGRLFETDAAQRKRTLLLLGSGALALFIVLRSFNLYGDPEHWATQKNTLFTFLSFINFEKYPPSLLYLCVTLGPALIALSLLERVNNPLSRAISVYGRVPFFYYVLHFYVLHCVAVVFFIARGHSFAEGLSGNLPFKFMIHGQGESLPVVYLVWAGAVLFFYPLCLWFSNLKNRRKDWWLSYL